MPEAGNVPEPATGSEPAEGPASEAGPEAGHEAGAEHDDDREPAPAPQPAPEDEAPSAPGGLPLPDEHPLAAYTLSVNGVERPVEGAWIGESLLYVLRERLGLAGAKDGCAQGECGACNVQVDGRLVASCLVPAATTAGSEVRTVEGLACDGEASDVQRALAAHGAVQCGFCVPGMAMTVHDLLEGNPAPTPLETRQALCGNLCRCSGYRGVLDAVEDVAASRREASEERAAAKEEAAGAAWPAEAEDPGATGQFAFPQEHEDAAPDTTGQPRPHVPHQAGPETYGAGLPYAPPPEASYAHDGTGTHPQDGGQA
ncbi:2Fe-2S iron-sulfur cluster binding domain-containing protein [Streptomyces sp. SPB074]|nr:2Fe-2S iron-sulfur cluster binding domain-containing protein [Streptomyces sp. SPB074]